MGAISRDHSGTIEGLRDDLGVFGARSSCGARGPTYKTPGTFGQWSLIVPEVPEGENHAIISA